MRHGACVGCSALSTKELGASDGVARHNIQTMIADVPRLILTAAGYTASGHWQASLSFFDEAIRELQDARRLAQSNTPSHLGTEGEGS